MSIEGLRESVWINDRHGYQRMKMIGQSRGAKRTKLKLSRLSVLWQQKHKSSRHLTGTATAASIKSETSLPIALGLRRRRRDPSKHKRSIKQNKYCFHLFKPKLPECFKVDSKQQRNLENIQHRQIVTLHRRRWNNLSERSTEAFNPRLQCQTPNTIDSNASSNTTSIVESTS